MVSSCNLQQTKQQQCNQILSIHKDLHQGNNPEIRASKYRSWLRQDPQNVTAIASLLHAVHSSKLL